MDSGHEAQIDYEGFISECMKRLASLLREWIASGYVIGGTTFGHRLDCAGQELWVCIYMYSVIHEEGLSHI